MKVYPLDAANSKWLLCNGRNQGASIVNVLSSKGGVPA